MDAVSFYNKFESLPSNLKKEVMEYLEKLLPKNNSEEKSKSVPKRGTLKGKIVIHADYDETLEDFKEYM
jgi:hypothetical protein